MTVLAQCTEPTTHHARARAWLCVGLTPVGLAAAGTSLLWMLDGLHAASFPNNRLGSSLGLVVTLLALAAAGTVALAAPAIALLLATTAVSEEGRAARSVLVASWLAFGLCVILFGVFGLVVWGPVLTVRIDALDAGRERSRGVRRR